jgi:hypothetical protein
VVSHAAVGIHELCDRQVCSIGAAINTAVKAQQLLYG